MLAYYRKMLFITLPGDTTKTISNMFCDMPENSTVIFFIQHSVGQKSMI